ncbi:MAG: anti-sigma factor antagonist [Clostridia bacterium]|nr:anti-sigma factor antagonist [Clostridia bacterium]
MGKATFTYEETGYFLRVKLKGDIDHHSAVAIRSGMDTLLYKIRPRRLYLDLSGVDFMDSSGLGLIMGRYALMKEIGGDVVVCDPCPGVERVIKLAGMERVVRIERSAAAKQDTAPGAVQRDKPRGRRVRKEVLK